MLLESPRLLGHHCTSEPCHLVTPCAQPVVFTFLRRSPTLRLVNVSDRNLLGMGCVLDCGMVGWKTQTYLKGL